MNEVVTAARTAREKLSSALAALQSPAAGTLIDTVAEPVAAAMSALHQIETTEGAALPARGPDALAAVRRALEALQLVPANHPVVDEATASVAGSLGLVFQLAERAETPEPTQSPQPALAEADPLAQTCLPQAELAATTRESPGPRRIHAQATAEGPAQAAFAEPSPVPSAPPQKPAEALPVEAALGAHSPTNFYKGLSGNDVIDDGGIFIATYQIPPLEQQLWLKVSLPGGFEFEALGQVVWTRESGGSDAPPGFGARFREISSEARQLVYRYVRNREPLFHDDF